MRLKGSHTIGQEAVLGYQKPDLPYGNFEARAVQAGQLLPCSQPHPCSQTAIIKGAGGWCGAV